MSPRLTKGAMQKVFSEHYFDYDRLSVWGERREPIFAEVVRILKKYGARTVFDVGAAFGHFVRYAENGGLRAAGSDISPQAVKIGRDRLGIEMHLGSVEELSVPTVDAVVSLDAFYYVADPRVELEAIGRMLKPGGFLLLRLRNCQLGTIPAEHLWGFSPRAITKVLESSGWLVESCGPAAYSKSRLSPLLGAAVAMNRALRRISKRVPILTQSFTVMARPPR